MRLPFTLLFISLLSLPFAHADVVLLNDSGEKQAIHESIELLEDPAGSLQIADVTKRSIAEKFKKPGSDYFSLGFTESAYWYRFTVENPYATNQKRLLLLRTPWIDQVDLYIPIADGAYQHRRMGDKLPFKQREIEHHQFISTLEVPPGTSAYLMRIYTPKPFMTPLFLMEPVTFIQTEWMRVAYYGVIFGSLFIMLLYNGIIYFSIRDRRYLFYCLYLASFFIMNFSYNGFSYQFLWPESPDWTRWSYSLSIYLFQITGLLFAISFLSSRTRMPKLHKLIRLYILFLLTAPLLTFLSGNDLLFNKLAIYSIFLYSPLIALAGLLALLSGFRAARFFVIASLASLGGAFFTAMTVAGFLSYSFISYHAVEFGLLIDMALLSLAMADRINLMNIEREIVQQRAMDREHAANSALQQAKQGLEIIIEKRTAELTQAKNKAEKMARVDVLTGASNRRAFEESAAAEFSRSRRHETHLSLFLFDIDNFKTINDTYGHSAGDAVIRHAAKLSREEVREIDTVGRVGGEEFAILLPETSLAQALEIAERIQQKMMKSIIESNGREIRYTASFGVASLEPEHDSLETAIQNADAAMYISKRSGRNRVTCWTTEINKP